MSKITEKIKFIRRQKGMSQQAFGDLLGYSRQHINNIERANTNPTVDFLKKIGLKLRINLNWLILDIGSPFLTKDTSTSTSVISEFKNLYNLIAQNGATVPFETLLEKECNRLLTKNKN